MNGFAKDWKIFVWKERKIFHRVFYLIQKPAYANKNEENFLRRKKEISFFWQKSQIRKKIRIKKIYLFIFSKREEIIFVSFFENNIGNRIFISWIDLFSCCKNATFLKINHFFFIFCVLGMILLQFHMFNVLILTVSLAVIVKLHTLQITFKMTWIYDIKKIKFFQKCSTKERQISIIFCFNILSGIWEAQNRK